VSAGPAGGFGGAGTVGGALSGAPGTPGPGSGRSGARALAGDYGFAGAGGDRATTGMPTTAGGGLQATATTTLTSAEQRLYDYISAHREGASYLMAVSSWEEAGEYILSTGQEVLNMGGFSGTVPEPTLAQVKNLVRTGQLRFFLISGSGSGSGAGFGASGGQATATAIDSWVASACATVPATDYSTGTASAASSAGTLYACARSS